MFRIKCLVSHRLTCNKCKVTGICKLYTQCRHLVQTVIVKPKSLSVITAHPWVNCTLCRTEYYCDVRAMISLLGGIIVALVAPLICWFTVQPHQYQQQSNCNQQFTYKPISNSVTQLLISQIHTHTHIHKLEAFWKARQKTCLSGVLQPNLERPFIPSPPSTST